MRNSCRGRRSVQVSQIVMANIYVVYCAVKLVLFKYRLVKCDSFKDILKYLRLGYLKKFNLKKNSIINFKMLLVMNNGGHKH